jgi:hypothetical protein
MGCLVKGVTSCTYAYKYLNSGNSQSGGESIFKDGNNIYLPFVYYRDFSCLAKIDQRNGDILSCKKYYESTNSLVQSLIVAEDFIYTLGTGAYSYKSHNSMVLKKINKTDNSIVWETAVYNGDDEKALKIVDCDSNYFFSISYTNNYYIISKIKKTDGVPIWNKQLTATSLNNSTPITEGVHGEAQVLFAAGKLYFLSDADNNSDSKLMLTRIDSSGTIDWAFKYSNTLDLAQENSSALVYDNDSGYIYAVDIPLNNPDDKFYIYKINMTTGVIEFIKKLSFTAAYSVLPKSMAYSSNHIYLAGFLKSPGLAGKCDLFVMCLNTDGTIDWFKGIGGSENDGALESGKWTNDDGEFNIIVDNDFIYGISTYRPDSSSGRPILFKMNTEQTISSPALTNTDYTSNYTTVDIKTSLIFTDITSSEYTVWPTLVTDQDGFLSKSDLSEWTVGNDLFSNL